VPDPLALVTTCWGVVMSLAPVLQIRLIIRKRDSSGISLSWILILLVGFVLWLAYGLSNRDLPIVITNVVNIIVTIALLTITRVYAPRPVPASTPAPAP